MTTEETQVYNYHVFPPFIDAYQCSLYENNRVTLDELKEIMESHAISWGAEAIGKCILEGKELPKYDNKIVLCCAYTYVGENNDCSDKYLIVVNDLDSVWYDNMIFIKGIVNPDWDVT